MMKKLLTAAMAMLMIACAAGKISVSALTTTWKMDRVYEKKVNVTNRENPNRDRYIQFFSDGTFGSGGAPYGDVSGSWEILPDNSLKITPQSQDEVGPSQWIVQIKGKTMTWKGTGSDALERLEVIWVRE